MIKIDNKDFKEFIDRVNKILNSSELYGKIISDMCQLQQVHDYVIDNYLSENQLEEFLQTINNKKGGD